MRQTLFSIPLLAHCHQAGEVEDLQTAPAVFLHSLDSREGTHPPFSSCFAVQRGELLVQAQANGCTRVFQGMQEQHQDQSWARGVVTSSQAPQQVLGVFPAQLSDADYDQLSRFPAF